MEAIAALAVAHVPPVPVVVAVAVPPGQSVAGLEITPALGAGATVSGAVVVAAPQVPVTE